MPKPASSEAVLGAAVAGGFLALLLIAYQIKGSALNKARREADDAEAKQAVLQKQVNDLKSVEASLPIARPPGRTPGSAVTDVAWTRLLQEIATVIPSDVWLTTFAGAPTAWTFGLQGFDHTSTARWILRMNELKSLTGLWVPSSQPGRRRRRSRR